MQSLLYLALLLSSIQVAFAGQTISASEAKYHFGENATVCGMVASARYEEHHRGHRTFLNLDNPNMYGTFMVVIWGEDRAKFGNPEEKFVNRRICVSGEVLSYWGVPEIVVTEPAQIQ